MASHAGRERWPFAFRPQRGELLYSWLARTAGVYQLSPLDLLPLANFSSALVTRMRTSCASIAQRACLHPREDSTKDDFHGDAAPPAGVLAHHA